MTENVTYCGPDLDQICTGRPERSMAPDAACFPGQEFWVPEFGSALILFSRHEEPNKVPPEHVLFDLYDPELSPEGVEHGVQTTSQRVFKEVKELPRKRYFFHSSDRRRSIQSNVQKFQRISLDDNTNYEIVQQRIDDRLSTARQLNPIVRQFGGPSPLVIPTYLSMNEHQLEAIGSESRVQTLGRIMNYIVEANEIAQDNDGANVNVYLADSHETTFALLLSKFFPGHNPQAEFGEIMGVTTGNPDNLAVLQYRDLPPRVISLQEYVK